MSVVSTVTNKRAMDAEKRVENLALQGVKSLVSNGQITRTE